MSIEEAKQRLSSGDLDAVKSICSGLLADNENDAKAWHLSGIASASGGDLETALECFRKATESEPDVALYHYNLGLAFGSMGNWQPSRDAYQTAVDLSPEFTEARNNLGNALLMLDRADEAADCFRALVEADPRSSDAHFNLANTLSELGVGMEAVEHYRKTLELSPEFAAARENLGRRLNEIGQEDEAKKVWQEWLEVDPGNKYAEHMLAAATGQNLPTRCDADYIRQEFNEDFAKAFDKQMQRLEYNSPRLIEETLSRLPLQNQIGKLEVLDAGCGTGICGGFLKEYAQQLIGLDLATAMLEEAEKLDVYDHLVDADLVSYLKVHPSEFDLVVSADTLCYFGELDEVLAAAAQSLKAGGWFVFTVEKETIEDAESEGGGYRLQKHGRYCHREAYVRRLLEESELQTESIVTDTQRKEMGRDVIGLIVTTRMPGADG